MGKPMDMFSVGPRNIPLWRIRFAAGLWFHKVLQRQNDKYQKLILTLLTAPFKLPNRTAACELLLLLILLL